MIVIIFYSTCIFNPVYMYLYTAGFLALYYFFAYCVECHCHTLILLYWYDKLCTDIILL